MRELETQTKGTNGMKKLMLMAAGCAGLALVAAPEWSVAVDANAARFVEALA